MCACGKKTMNIYSQRQAENLAGRLKKDQSGSKAAINTGTKTESTTKSSR